MYLQYWLPSGICVAVVSIILFIYNMQFVKRVSRARSAVEFFNSEICRMDRCDINNVDMISIKARESKNSAVIEAWERFIFDIKIMFDSVVAPQPEGYFTYGDIFAHPAKEKELILSWKLIPAITLISLLASPTILALSGEYSDPLKMRIAIGASLVSLIVIASVFTVFYTRSRNHMYLANRALFTLNRTLTCILPTATESAQAALLLAATNKNTISFEKTAADIAQKIDAFALDKLAPMITQTFDDTIRENITPGVERLEAAAENLAGEIVKKQDEGMKVLAASFSENLTTTMQNKINSMAGGLDVVNDRMKMLEASLRATVSDLSLRFTEDRETLNRTIITAEKAVSSQQRISESISALTSSIGRTEDIIAKLEERDERIFDKMDEASGKTLSLQEQLKQQLEAYAEEKDAAFGSFMAMSNGLKESLEANIAKTNQMIEKSVNSLNTAVAESALSMKDEMQGTIASVTSAFTEAASLTKSTVEGSAESIKNAVEESTARLNEATNETVARLSETSENAIVKTNASVNAAVAGMNKSFEEALAKTNEAVAGAIERTNQVVSESFVTYSDKLLATLQRSAEANEKVAEDYEKMLGELSEFSKEQYEKSAAAEAAVMTKISEEMGKTLGGVGTEIYKAITDASVNTGEIVQKLAETTEKIKHEYDFYFTRVESQNQNILNEMEYHMQAVLSRFSGEAGGVMDKLENSVNAAMGMFQNSTAQLLASLSDEARSIGLYTKDLNLDIAELTTTLRESVQVFTESMRESTVKTFADFDKGLSEINLRFANTIEAVRESVENLPKVLQGRK